MMAYSEDHIALAAEYALGTLDADERAQVETMMSVDKDFTAMVQAWEQKLGVLNQMVGSIEPRPEVWDKIRTAIGHSAPQEPLVLPQAPPPPPPPPVPDISELAVAVDDSNVVQLSAKVRRWRNIATLTTAIAAALVAMITVQAWRPELLPEGLRPKPRTLVVEAKAPAAAAPAPSAQYVAVLQKDVGSPAFILTVDGATKNFTVRKVGAAAEPGKSFELWLISDKLQRPRSLGVIGGSDFTARPVLSSYDADTINAATFAVTVEQAGGSPDGKPTSAPIFAGKLIETVPPPAAARPPAEFGKRGFPRTALLTEIPAGLSFSFDNPASRCRARLVRKMTFTKGIAQKKTPVGSGRFPKSQLGGSWGLHILTWQPWGAGKEPREFEKIISAPSMCLNW